MIWGGRRRGEELTVVGILERQVEFWPDESTLCTLLS